MLLTNKTPGIEDIFIPDDEIILYDTLDECIDVINHYKKNQFQCYQIGERARKRAWAHHTFDNRMSTILQEVR
jgi:spore maturation protein CgeB